MNGLANLAATDLEQLYRESKTSLCGIRKRKDVLKSFIEHSPANFFYLNYAFIYAFINSSIINFDFITPHSAYAPLQMGWELAILIKI